MSALCQKRTHAVQHRTDGHGRLAAALERPYPRPITRCPPIGMERCLTTDRGERSEAARAGGANPVPTAQ